MLTKKFLWSLVILSAVVLISTLGLTNRKEKTLEGKLLAKVYDNVVTLQVMNAQMDLDKLVWTITANHPRSQNEAESLTRKVIHQVLVLGDEVKFHNTDLMFYKKSMFDILTNLSKAELIDALYYIEHADQKALKRSILNAKRYWHDALLFVPYDSFRKDSGTYSMINSLNPKKIARSQIIRCLEETMELRK